MLMITGAGGQLGKAAVERCRKADIDFISADRTELDITNKDAIASFVRGKNIDCILNCAAYTAVDAAGYRTERAVSFTIDRDSPVIRYVDQMNGANIRFFQYIR